ncbi:MAG: transglutaminase family protein [Caulobacteraceae bacterium]
MGARDEVGTQIPGITVSTGTGTCRDFAWLMIEVLRRLGYAARFVTGYLYSPRLDRARTDGPGEGHTGAGSTHAWCEVFLPSLGWMEFDPTNGLAESPDLIRVASTRMPEPPISGAIVGDPRGVDMSVKVDVRMIAQPSPGRRGVGARLTPPSWAVEQTVTLVGFGRPCLIRADQ